MKRLILFAVILISPLTGVRLAEACSDGQLIAFTAALRVKVSIADRDVDRGGIFVTCSNGTGTRQLTEFDTFKFDFEQHGINLPDDHPAFSPDGSKIVFTSNRVTRCAVADIGDGLGRCLLEGNHELFVMDVNGANPKRLTFNDPGLDIEPVFSPDGTKIAFVSERPGSNGGKLDIFIMDLAGCATVGTAECPVTQLTNTPEEEIEPHWSPDGTKIAFARVLNSASNPKDVFVINADGTGEKRLTNVAGEDHDPTFSPDGTQLVISSERDGTKPFGDTFRISAADGGGALNITRKIEEGLTRGGGGGDPSWSPNGDKVVLFSARFKEVFGKLIPPMNLFVVDPAGNNPVQLAQDGLLNIHPNFGRQADLDANGVPDYLQSGTVVPNADLEVTQTLDRDTFNVGDRIKYILSIANKGPDRAENVWLRNWLPKGWTSLASIASEDGDCLPPAPSGDDQEGGAATCQFDAIEPGASVTVEVEADADTAPTSPDSLDNLGLVTAQTNDPDSNNNQSAIETPIGGAGSTGGGCSLIRF